MGGPSFPASDTELHLSMLNDRRRTTSFLDAIAEAVRPGDVVVDIGAGTGVLSLASVRAGAAHVYAIEAGSFGPVAEALFEANGVADRVTVLRAHSFDVTLPERADVMVAELIGHEPLAEGVLGVTADAVTRLLKPGARLVPSGLRLLALPVSVAAGELQALVLRPERLAAWQSWYGFDFGALDGAAEDGIHYLNPWHLRHWQPLGDPVVLADIDLRQPAMMWYRTDHRVTATASGPFDGIVVYFELRAGGRTMLSTHPSAVDQDNHWLSPVRVFRRAHQVTAGEEFGLTCWGIVSGLSGVAGHHIAY